MVEQVNPIFLVSTSPHFKSRNNVPRIMRDVIIALIPATICAVYFFGLRALFVIIVSIVTAIITEYISQKCLGKEVTITDGSAVVTGLLLAFTLPPGVPFWIPLIGTVVAVFLVKHLFGGLGFNIFNPALAARAVLLASWPVQMTTWTTAVPGGNIFADAVTTASPLGILKLHLTQTLPTYLDFIYGQVPGSLGETSKLALLIGAIYLLYRRVIDWQTPISFGGTVIILSLLLQRDPVLELLAGGLILGAFFMATDYVTSPVSKKGKLVFGLGCGILTILIRVYGGFPEGVCYSILLMNCFTPLIDKYIRPKIFGTK